MAESYALQNTAAEQARLTRQSAALRPITTRLFRAAGIGPGMSVLDVGCGNGDVSAIAAELVGTTGRVVGFDRDSRQVAAAAARFTDGAVASFVQATIDDPPEGAFDAIVGRLVLMYQLDLVGAVSSLIRRLRPGGVVAFIEINLRPDGSQVITWPPMPLEESVRSWVAQGFSSTHSFVGLQLPAIFRRAGLVPQPPYDSTAVIYEGRERAEMFAALVGSMMPTLTAAGIDPDEINVDTLADRLYAAGGDDQISALGPMIGVWASKPA
jgi:ubiquinone/menaquinone biosynthesis C-methylase UbiE